MSAADSLPCEIQGVSFNAGGRRLIKDMTFQLTAGPRSGIWAPARQTGLRRQNAAHETL